MFEPVLYVDNNSENINNFKHHFHSIYNIYLAQNTLQAKTVLNNIKIKVVLTDYTINDNDKKELFEFLAEEYPQTIKIILSSNTDVNSVLKAINKYRTFSFLPMPFNPDELQNTINNAIEIYNLKNQNVLLLETLKRLNTDLSKYNEELEHENVMRKQTENELKQHKENLEKKVNERTQSLRKTNSELEHTINKLNNTNEKLSESNKKLKQEISARTKIENKLKTSEEKFKLFIEESSDSFVILKPNGEIIEWNNGSEAIYKLTKQEAIGKHIFDIEKNFTTHYIDEKETLKDHKSIVNKYLNNSGEYSELRYSGECITLDNKKKYLNIHLFSIKTSKEVMVGRVCRDITSRHNIELELQNHKNYLQKMVDEQTKEIIQREERFRIVIDNMPILINALSDENKFLFWNKECEKVTGYSASEIIGNEKALELLYPDKTERERMNNEYEQNKSYKNSPLELVTKFGKKRTIEWSNFPKVIISGWNTWWAIGIDVTEQKGAEQKIKVYQEQLEELVKERTLELDSANKKLKEINEELLKKNYELALFNKRLGESESKLQSFIDQSADGITIIDENDKFIEYNASLEEISGVKRKDVIGKNSWTFLKMLQQGTNKQKEEKVDEIKTQLETGLKSTKSVRIEGTIVNKHGKTRHLQITAFPIKLDDKIHVGRIIRDVTEQKNNELQLEQYHNHLEELINIRTSELQKSERRLRLVSDSLPGGAIFRLRKDPTRNYYLEYASARFTQITGVPVEKAAENLNNLFQVFHPDDFLKFKKHLRESSQKETQLDAEIRLLINKKYKWVIIRSLPYTDINNQTYWDGIILDITDKKLAEEEKQRSEEKFRNIFNSSMDGIVITKPNQKILDANISFKRLVGYSEKEINKLKTTDIIADEFYDEVIKLTSSKAALLPPIELEIIRSNNEIVPVEINSRRIKLDDQNVFLSIVRDITERKNFERRMLDTIIQTEEKERERFAKNLHDDLGPLLSSIRMYINTLPSVTDEKKNSFIISQVNDILKEALQTTKDISNDLSPHILTNYGLVSAVESFIQKVQSHLRIYFDSNLGSTRLNNNIETTFYRIIKELINNTIKHAEAKDININLDIEGRRLVLEYTDDGKGFNPKEIDSKKSGMGLFNIKSRIKSLNGKFNFNNKSQGVLFEIDAPLDI